MDRRKLLIAGVVGCLVGGYMFGSRAGQIRSAIKRAMLVQRRKKPIPDWVVYPQTEWLTASPREAGFDIGRWEAYLAKQTPRPSNRFGEVHVPTEFGTVLCRGGYLIHHWGDPDYLYQSASVGKAFTKLALQIAIEKKLINSVDDKVSEYWIGDGRTVDGKHQGTLDGEHKFLNSAYHQKLTFAQLARMEGGFRVTNGHSWKGDARNDNYAIDPPGRTRNYSSGGYWRLTQTLTYIFQESLKDVLDAHLFSKIGIPADRWYWLSGKHVFDDLPAPGSTSSRFYPDMPGYGTFVDPPYEFPTVDQRTVPCFGGGGWAGMTPKDLARVGLLIATGGIWESEQLIENTWLLDGHEGGNDSSLRAWSHPIYGSWGQVTTQGLQTPKLGSIAKRGM